MASIAGLGGSSIKSMIIALDRLSSNSEDLDDYGLTAMALATMIKILERIDNIIDDGITADEVDDLKGLLKEMGDTCKCDVKILDSLQKKVNELESELDEMERFAPGLVQRLTSSSGSNTLSEDAIESVSEMFKSAEQGLDATSAEDATDIELDGEIDAVMEDSRLAEMLRRQMLDRISGSFDRNQMRNLMDKLKQKQQSHGGHGISPVAQNGPLGSSHQHQNPNNMVNGIRPAGLGQLDPMRSSSQSRAQTNSQDHHLMDLVRGDDLNDKINQAKEVEQKLEEVSVGAINLILGTLADAISQSTALNAPLEEAINRLDELDAF